jgi:hypothetical protein
MYELSPQEISKIEETIRRGVLRGYDMEGWFKGLEQLRDKSHPQSKAFAEAVYCISRIREVQHEIQQQQQQHNAGMGVPHQRDTSSNPFTGSADEEYVWGLQTDEVFEHRVYDIPQGQYLTPRTRNRLGFIRWQLQGRLADDNKAEEEALWEAQTRA